MIDELPTPEDQWKSYLSSRRTYDALLYTWQKGGALGPPPPRPIPPHTPGFNPRLPALDEE